MSETFPRGRQVATGTYRVLCRSCGQTYAWNVAFGHRRCVHCKRRVPVEERPLLPGEERKVREMLQRAEWEG